jgi:hypothetical protein
MRILLITALMALTAKSAEISVNSMTKQSLYPVNSINPNAVATQQGFCIIRGNKLALVSCPGMSYSFVCNSESALQGSLSSA